MPLTHRQLCDLAVKWLQRPASRSGPGCQVAFSECRADWKGETPDAIGFRAAVFKEASVVVEVKVSRADFLADRKKPHRTDPSLGMGTYRYFMAPAGLISPEELPARWGLIEVGDRSSLNVVCGHVLLKYREEDNWRHEPALNAEWTLLVRMLNRVGDVEKAQGCLKRPTTATPRWPAKRCSARGKRSVAPASAPTRPRPWWRRYATCEGALKTRGWSVSTLIPSSRNRYGPCG